jgi:phage terminase large subunit-like protein
MGSSPLAREIAARLLARVSEPLETRLSLMEPHVGQREVLVSRARFRVVACGRRWGKTEVGKAAILRKAVGGANTWWLAPTWDQGQQVWRSLKSAVRTLPGRMYINNSERLMVFPSGGQLAVKTTGVPENLRGAGLDFVVLDEAAFMADSVWGEVVRPMLLTTEGSALFLSTPLGKNWFWRVWQAGRDPLESDWQAFHYPTGASPLISQSELDSIRRSTVERVWQQEYEAQFLEGEGAVFRGIAAASGAPMDAEPEAGRRYVMGVDWGKSNDYTVLVVLDVTESPAQMVAMDRFNKIDYAFQRKRLGALYERWKPRVVWAEANSIGTPNIEDLSRAGIPVRPFMTTAKSKPPLIEGLALAIERGDVALQGHDVLLDELAAYTLERLAGGGYRYSAPAGGHDDTVIALALAWHGATAAMSSAVIFS